LRGSETTTKKKEEEESRYAHKNKEEKKMSALGRGTPFLGCMKGSGGEREREQKSKKPFLVLWRSQAGRKKTIKSSALR